MGVSIFASKSSLRLMRIRNRCSIPFLCSFYVRMFGFITLAMVDSPNLSIFTIDGGDGGRGDVSR